MESTLAVVDSEEKQMAITAELKVQSHWIGLYRDPENTSLWLWIDSSRLCKGCGYWAAEEPNNYDGRFEGCGEMYFLYSGKWNDQTCSHKRRYICQKRGWYYSFVDKSFIREYYLIVINWLRGSSRVRSLLSQNK